MKFKLVYLFVLGMSFTSLLRAQRSLERIDRDLGKIAHEFPFKGFAVSIVGLDTVLLSNGYGYANVESKTAFTNRTIQPIGSVSKTFVGLALIKAIELGYFTIETPVNDILPFKIVNPHSPNDTIRVKHLFTHTSGILDNEPTYLKTYQINKKPDRPLGDFLKDYLVKGGLHYQNSNFDNSISGQKYNYSNIASALAAYLVEASSGLLFNQFTDQYIFEPMKLEDTHWFYDEAKAMRYATLYEEANSSFPGFEQLQNGDGSLKIYSCITYPDGSLRTSLVDLERYVQELLKGYHRNSSLLSEDKFAMLFQKYFLPESLPQNMSKNMLNQAVFWSYNKKMRLIHTGSDPGVFAVISLDFQKNIGRIVLMNTGVDADDNDKLIEGLQAISATLENLK